MKYYHYLFIFIVTFGLMFLVRANPYEDCTVYGNCISQATPPGTTGNSSGNGTDITSASANLTYWKLDGTNAPPSANWNMGRFGFSNVGNTSFVRNIYFNTSSAGEWGGIMNTSSIISSSTTTDTKLFPEDGANSNAGFVLGRGNTLYYDSGLAFPYIFGFSNYINNSKANILSGTSPVLVLGSNNVLNGTRYNGVSVFGSSNNILNPINRSVYFGYGNNLLWMNATFASFNNNVFAPNLCYSNGVNCTTSGASANFTNVAFINDTTSWGIFNVTANFFNGLFNWTTINDGWLSFNGATLSFNATKIGDNYYNKSQSDRNTTSTVNIVQNYTNTYYASQGYRQTLCWSTTNSVGTARFLGIGSIINKKDRGFRPAHNGSILAMTSQVSGSDPGAVWVGGTAPKITLYLNISSTSVYIDSVYLPTQLSVWTLTNASTRGIYNFTTFDNITVATTTNNTATYLVSSYCVEYVYDQ